MFYAPKYWWSAGGGWVELMADDGSFERDIVYVRANVLTKRWNLPADYPMVAPDYAAKRSSLAKQIGLGKGTGGRARAS